MVSSLEEQHGLEHELLDAKVDKLSAAALARLDEVHLESLGCFTQNRARKSTGVRAEKLF